MNTLCELFSFDVTVMAAQTDDSWIFGLDWQFLADALILAMAMLVLFALLSFLLFNPARALMKARQEKIDADIRKAKEDKEEAVKLREQYNSKMALADKEADELLSDARKKALKREAEITGEAKAEADRIIKRANKEAELEVMRVQDDMKKEMIEVASLMAGKFVENSLTEEEQRELVDRTLKEMGDDTWQA